MSRPYYKNYKDITLLARALRKNQTASEQLLWEVLRGRKLEGYKYLRQHPVFYRVDKGWRDFYIADFYCRQLRLIIELDRLIRQKQKEYDKERDEKLKAKGLKIIRIKNDELSDINSVITIIKQIIKLQMIQLSDKN
jgi:leucyl-tRNA synthetase